MQVSAGYTGAKQDRARIATFTEEDANGKFAVSGTETSNFNPKQLSATATAGYDFALGNVTFGPRIGIEYYDIDSGTYSETGTSGLELTFYNVTNTSLQSVVGLQGSIALSTGFGAIVPQASMYWRHEFQNDQLTLQTSFVDDTRHTRFTYQTQPPDRDFFEINVGVSAFLAHSVQPFLNFRALVGQEFFTSYSATIGVRVPF